MYLFKCADCNGFTFFDVESSRSHTYINFYKNSQSNRPNQPSARYLSQALNYARNDYVVQWKNYLEFSTPKHRKQYLRAKYDLNKTDARKLNDALTHGTNMNAENPLSNLLTIERRILPTMPPMENVFNKKVQEALYEEEVVRYRYMMLKEIERADPSCERYRRFTIVPICNSGRVFMTIDKKVASDLLRHAKSSLCPPDWDSETLCGQWVEEWTDLFRTDALQRFTRKDNVELAKVCRTDGIQMHVIVDRWLESKPPKLTTTRGAWPAH